MTFKKMPRKRWKGERAGYKKFGQKGYRSNKYRFRSGADSAKEPGPGKRGKFWVGGYVRKDGVKVKGHYRNV